MFYTSEFSVGADLNGDGDKTDSIIRYYVIPQIHQGDLILDDNDVHVIEGEFNINGSIIVTENATLTLKNALLNFMQTGHYQFNITFSHPVTGNPKFIVENSNITTNNYSFSIYFKDNSSAAINGLTAPTHTLIYLYHSSSANISNSEINHLEMQSYSTLRINNSRLNTLYTGDYAKAYVTNSEILLKLLVRGNSIMTILNCSIIDGETKSQAKCYIYDSTMVNGKALEDSRVWLYNTTITGNGEVNDTAIIYLYWYLKVQVVDSENSTIPYANVTAYYSNGTAAESTLTETNGWTRLTLMEKTLNATGEYPVGNYTVTATYETYVGQESVNMTGNKEITIQLPFIIPEFPTSLLLPLCIATTLAIITLSRKARSKLKPYKHLS